MDNFTSKDLNFIRYDKKYAEECHKTFMSQEQTARYTLWRPTNNVDEAITKLENWETNVKDCGFFRLIQEKESGQVIGFICTAEVESGVYDHLGIAIGQNFLRRGYGFQTLTAVIDYVKNSGGKEIHYSHFKANEASKNLALKCGFKYVREAKRIRRYDGKEFDEVFYILKIK